MTEKKAAPKKPAEAKAPAQEPPNMTDVLVLCVVLGIGCLALALVVRAMVNKREILGPGGGDGGTPPPSPSNNGNGGDHILVDATQDLA